jgi:hypothetical protein
MRLFILLVSLLSIGCTARPVSLFNGQDLSGWEIHSGHATYRVEDGTILGTTAEGSGNTFLCTTREYCDFVLQFEVKCDPALNSGVQIRSHLADGQMLVNGRKLPADRMYGYQVEIATAASRTSGGIYDEARRGWLDNISTRDVPGNIAFRDNEWNHYRIVAQGNRIRTFVNGQPCADLTDDMDACGLIGLQVHGIPKGTGPYSVRWRNITIRELKPGEKVD